MTPSPSGILHARVEAGNGDVPSGFEMAQRGRGCLEVSGQLVERDPTRRIETRLRQQREEGSRREGHVLYLDDLRKLLYYI